MPIVSDKHEAKKQKILQKGVAVMRERGFNGTSVKDIVGAAGIPKGSFYFYFKSKEDFAIQALTAYVDDVDRVLNAALTDSRNDAVARLTEFYDRRIRLNTEHIHCAHGCFVSNIASEMADSNPRLRGAVDEFFSRGINQLAHVIRQAQQAGELSTKAPPEQLAMALENAWRGALIAMKACQCREPLDNFKRITLTSLLV